MDGAGLGTSIVLAAFLVPAVSIVKKPHWPRQVKYLIGMAAALVCALVGSAIDGGASASDFGTYLATALATSQTIYVMYFQDTSLEEKLSEK